MRAIIGRKIGMTQLYSEDGRVIPVTVIEAGPCPVIGLRTKERHGYEAVQIAYGEIREKRLTRSRIGQLKKGQLAGKKVGDKSTPVWTGRLVREVPSFEAAEVGQQVKVDAFEVGGKVDVIGTSKGKGFAGVVRKHHFSGGDEAHGCKTKRQPGSIGASAYPSRVIKGKKLPAQMGNYRVTVKNLTVIGIDAAENLIWVRGAVPGATNGYVLLRQVAGKGGK
jgi:large subunit ribosomal protein L3